MIKTIFLLNIGDYAPEITAVTYPAVERYAQKIGASVIVISKRKYPDFPVVYEKLQIYELAKKLHSDWNIYIDSDCLLHPDTPDITKWLEKDTVFQVNSDPADIRFRLPVSDKRNIGTCNWFTIFSDQCIDLFNPEIGMSYDEMLLCMTPTEKEAKVFDSRHLIDDYILSTNLAKYGFKYKNASDFVVTKHQNFFHHEYLISEEDKLNQIRQFAREWEDQKSIVDDFCSDK